MKLLSSFFWFSKKYSDDCISAHSAQVSFFVVISLFPFVLFLLTLIQYTPLTKDMLIQSVDKVFPSAMYSTMNSWINEIYSMSSKTLLSITILSALWAGSKGFLGLITGIQRIYGIKETRNYVKIRLLAIVYTISFSLILAITLLVLVYGNKIFLFLSDSLPFVNDLAILVFAFRATLGLAIFFWFFVLLYKIFPNKKVRMRDQMPGAFFASVLWITFSFLYSFYIDNFANMSSLYGSLAYIVLFMLWLFFCMNFVFIGAEINIFYKDVRPQLNKVLKEKSQDNNASK